MSVIMHKHVEALHINPRLGERNKGHEVRFSGIDTQPFFASHATTASLAMATRVGTVPE